MHDCSQVEPAMNQLLRISRKPLAAILAAFWLLFAGICMPGEHVPAWGCVALTDVSEMGCAPAPEAPVSDCCSAPEPTSGCGDSPCPVPGEGKVTCCALVQEPTVPPVAPSPRLAPSGDLKWVPPPTVPALALLPASLIPARAERPPCETRDSAHSSPFGGRAPPRRASS